MLDKLEAVKGLIIHMAMKFHAPGHFAMESEELISEGYLVYSQVINKNPELEGNDFIAMFKTCFYNHLKTMLDKYRYRAKRGYMAAAKSIEGDEPVEADNSGFYYIDLSEVAESLGAEGFEELYYNNYVDCLRSILKQTPDSLALFEVLIEPPAEVCDLAIAESKRKAHLHKQGFLVKGAEVVTIKQRHICQYLGWSLTKLTDNMSVLRPMVSKIILGTESSFAV